MPAPPRSLVHWTLSIPRPWTGDFTSASLHFPNLKLGSEVLLIGLLETPVGVPSRGSLCPGPEPYHELGVAILEGAPRVPVALLLAIHHAALHSVLDLGRESRGGRRPARPP